jgi:ParB-like chromosome segregation protein Spo0J
MQIEQIPVERLNPYANNARTHSKEQIEQVASSIQEFGWMNPVIIDGTGTIIAGHGRVMAAKHLGHDLVPCVRHDHLTEAQMRAYVLADNQLALNAGWDDDLLAVELHALQDLDFNLDLIGFTNEEIENLLTDGETPSTGLTDPDDAPNPKTEPTTQIGDIWMLGAHRLMCGDSLDHETVAKLLGGGCC